MSLADTKDAEEIITATFKFENDLAGETIVAASQDVAIAVLSGTDAAVGAMLNGAAVVDGTNVLQSVQAGVNGANYELRARVDTSGGRRLVLELTLPVRRAS